MKLFKKLIIRILILLVCAMLVFFIISIRVGNKNESTPSPSGNKSDCETEMKSSNDNSSFENFNGTPKSVDFSNFLDAKTFYTRITETVSSGPNFAKHFTLVYWGCGTDCYGYAVVDANTGEIVAYSPANGEYRLRNGYGLDSTFFVMDPVNAGQERRFYKITKGDNGKYQLEIACTETAKEDMYGPVK